MSTGYEYECLEAGCGWTCTASDEEALVTSVQQHVAEAHDSFEVEDIILANATAVGPGATS